MQGYFIRSSKITPSVYFNPNKNLLDIRGKSSPENPLPFYNYIFKSLDQYHFQDYATITANLAFDYFNTSTSKCIYMVLKKLNTLAESGKLVTINWYFEADDMRETGEDIESFFDIEFNMILVNEIKVLGSQKKKGTSEMVAA